MIIPLSWRIAAAAILIAAIGALTWTVHHHIYMQGYSKAKAEDAAAAQESHDIKEADLAGVGILYAEQAAKDRIITKTITEKVTEYVPITDPLLSGGFRLLHDAAATGKALDDSSRINAPSVTSQDVAKTVADNYADCRYDKNRLAALQDVVRVLNGEANAKEKN